MANSPVLYWLSTVKPNWSTGLRELTMNPTVSNSVWFWLLNSRLHVDHHIVVVLGVHPSGSLVRLAVRSNA